MMLSAAEVRSTLNGDEGPTCMGVQRNSLDSSDGVQQGHLVTDSHLRVDPELMDI